MFGLIVISYVITVIGIPVYFHYCGGELEEISYLTKANSCCGEEEPEDDGCCKDESLIVKSTVDFTIKKSDSFLPLKTVCDLFYVSMPYSEVSLCNRCSCPSIRTEFPPPPFQNTLLISTSVLRI